MKRHYPSRRPRGFTLVELLVVIGIIALLISILLPSLSKARKAANTVACSANIHSILQAMQIYATAYDGSIPGAPATSGRFLFAADWGPAPGINNGNCPNVSQSWDWEAPIARSMGIDFEEGGTTTLRLQRFEFLRNHKAFQCTEASGITAIGYSGSGVPGVKAGVPISYACASQFLLLPFGDATKAGLSAQGSSGLTSPPGYSPKITAVGQGSTKIYIADGCRYSNGSTAPDIDLNYNGTGGGGYADIGAFTTRSNCWNRTPPSGSTGDGRIYAFRHGNNTPGGKDFRLNVGFFDGHVSNLSDLDAANPNLWMPKGTIYDPAGSGFPMAADATALYGSGKREID